MFHFAGTPEAFHFLGGNEFRLRQGFAPIRGQNTWTPHLRRHKMFHFAGTPSRRLVGKRLLYSRPSNSSIHRLFTASDGIRLVGAKSACLRFRLRRNLRPLPCSSSPHKIYNFAGAPFGRLAGKRLSYSRPSSSSIQRLFTASLGMRQSPRGLRATEPTLGPSGRQERLNCWEKKRR